MHDPLCRCYVLKLLATFASNEPAASLKELYTRVYKYIEGIEGMNQAKCVSDCLQYFVETQRSVQSLFDCWCGQCLQHCEYCSSTAGSTIDEHASSLCMIFRASIRLGKYFIRKSTDQEALSAVGARQQQCE